MWLVVFVDCVLLVVFLTSVCIWDVILWTFVSDLWFPREVNLVFVVGVVYVFRCVR